ncbi:Ig-like domain-containing protein [Pseudomonas sp. 681]|uniref:Ig-like domain-containing protein n=1 Tax=Pseudomonas fungipugnans TaxID=3024217 RepID=A0ABT6QVU7_9PSED|nr:Ig-like domain-containing protein [Pseudomonas sp. 681]MDI2595009.1 Ig-like domain-containing protein [Pseudomonas sp. 681]
MNFFKSLLAWIAKPFYPEDPLMNITTLASVLIVGATMQLVASEAAVFESSDTAVATVDATGLVTAVAPGSVAITATSPNDVNNTSLVNLSITAAPEAVTALPVASAAPAVAPAPSRDVIQVLEGILIALGHELPACWAEAAALAKKVV